jgi:hypothetical protein
MAHDSPWTSRIVFGDHVRTKYSILRNVITQARDYTERMASKVTKPRVTKLVYDGSLWGDSGLLVVIRAMEYEKVGSSATSELNFPTERQPVVLFRVCEQTRKPVIEVQRSTFNSMLAYVLCCILHQMIEAWGRASLPPLPPTTDGCEAHREDHCGICTELMSSGELSRVPVCGHMFHTACINPWWTHQKTCPVCRSGPLNEQRAEAEPVPSSRAIAAEA